MSGAIGNIADMIDMMDACVSSGEPMPAADIQKMMGMAQSAHEAMTGAKKAKAPKAVAALETKKPGVVYVR